MSQLVRSSVRSVEVQPMFLVGRDVEGHWLAVGLEGRSGGLFSSQEAALRYATFETDHRNGAVRRTDEPISLPYARHAART